MTDNINRFDQFEDDELAITTKTLAKRWGMKVQTLISWRRRGNGPKFYKLGYKNIVYKLSDVLEFEDEHEALTFNIIDD